MPAIFERWCGHGLPGVGDLRVDYGHKVERCPRSPRWLLLLSYAGGLFFSLRTHRELFNPLLRRGRTEERAWPVRRSVL